LLLISPEASLVCGDAGLSPAARRYGVNGSTTVNSGWVVEASEILRAETRAWRSRSIPQGGSSGGMARALAKGGAEVAD